MPNRKPREHAFQHSNVLLGKIEHALKREERQQYAGQLRNKLKQLVGFYGQRPGHWAIAQMEQHVHKHGTSSFTAEEFAKTKKAIVKKTRMNFIMNYHQKYKNKPEKRIELLRKLKRGLRMELKELLNPAETKEELAVRILSDLKSRKTIIDAGDEERFAEEAIIALRETRRDTLDALMKYVDREIGKIVRELGRIEK